MEDTVNYVIDLGHISDGGLVPTSSCPDKAGFEAKAVTSGKRLKSENGGEQKKRKRGNGDSLHSRSFSEATRGAKARAAMLSRSRSDASSSFEDENSRSKRMLRELLMLSGMKDAASSSPQASSSPIRHRERALRGR